MKQPPERAIAAAPILAREMLRQQLQSLPAEELLVLLRGLDPALLKAALQPAISPADDGANKREAPRHRTLRRAKIVYNNQMCVIDCLIRDMSLTGCRVRVSNPGTIPNHFVLHIGGTTQKHGCDVSWRNPRELGLQFVD